MKNSSIFRIFEVFYLTSVITILNVNKLKTKRQMKMLRKKMNILIINDFHITILTII